MGGNIDMDNPEDSRERELAVRLFIICRQFELQIRSTLKKRVNKITATIRTR